MAKVFNRAAWFGAVSAIAISVPAVAQQRSGEAAADIADIVVTGTRLQTSGFTAPTPTTVLNSAAIQQVAPAALADVVNRLPSVRLTSGPGQSQRITDSGSATVDLRGLGSVRTLVLVDGNRFTPTNENGTVSTDLIPTSLIERIDVVTGGASAAYGSDAVAGVVNFILAKDIKGIRGTLQKGVSQYGDASETVLNLAGGFGFGDGRGRVIFGGDYSRNDGVGTIYSREWGRRQPGLISNGRTRPAGTPAQSFATDVMLSAVSAGGLISAGPLRGTAFGPGGTTFPFEYGTVYSNLMVGGSNPGLNPFGNWPLLTPNRRLVTLGRVSYDFGGVDAFVEASYARSESNNFTTFNQTTFQIRRDNVFLPDEIRNQAANLNLNTIPVGRALTETGGLKSNNYSITKRVIGGLSGKISDRFSWDVSYQYGVTDNRNETYTDVFVARYAAAVDAIAGPNGPMCRAAATMPGCVPINIFGQGSPSAAALNYVTGTVGGQNRRSTRQVLAVNTSGSPFDTWAGPVQVAIGGEYRRDTLDATTGEPEKQDSFFVANYRAYASKVSIKEVYAEVGVPLLRDAPMADNLGFNGAVRYADYSTSGGVTTWKGGLTWDLLSGVRLRATRSRDIRAATLADLVASFGSGSAISSFINPFTGLSGSLKASSGSNPNLTPEKADNLTLGAVVSPGGALSGLRLSADYFSIKIKDVITTVGAAETVQRCFSGEQMYCAAITFGNLPYGIANVDSRPFNLAQRNEKGLDLEVAYTFNMPGDAGQLSVRALATHLFSLKAINDGIAVERSGTLQSGGLPKWQGNADITYTNRNFTSTLSGRYVAAARFDPTRVGPEDAGYDPALQNSININRFPSAVYFDLYGSYKFHTDSGDATIFAVVQNLLNKQPPQYAAIGINSGGNPYDLIGRRFRVGVRFNM